MEVKELNVQRVCEILNEIIELEMAGVVRYARLLMVTGLIGPQPLLLFCKNKQMKVWPLTSR